MVSDVGEDNTRSVGGQAADSQERGSPRLAPKMEARSGSGLPRLVH